MALTKKCSEIRNAVRKLANVEGASARLRHPDADLNDYINRALGSLHRILTEQIPDQRLLSSEVIPTEAGESSYDLPATFDSLISVDLSANGRRTWLESFEMNERPNLTSPDAGSQGGVPYLYRLRAGEIELLPEPAGVYSVTLWYVPAPTQFTADGDSYDTINRLDDYLIPYACRFVAIKEKQWELMNACAELVREYRAEVESVARGRDKNSPARIVDESCADRFGRRRRR